MSICPTNGDLVVLGTIKSCGADPMNRGLGLDSSYLQSLLFSLMQL